MVEQVQNSSRSQSTRVYDDTCPCQPDRRDPRTRSDLPGRPVQGRPRRHDGVRIRCHRGVRRRKNYPLRPGRRSEACAPRRDGDSQLRIRLPDLRRLSRQPRPLPADADDRGLRRAAVRLAEQIRVSHRAPVCGQGVRVVRCEGVPRRMPEERHHHELRLLHRIPAIGRCLVRGSGAARLADCGGQGSHEPQRAGRTFSTRRRAATTNPRH